MMWAAQSERCQLEYVFKDEEIEDEKRDSEYSAAFALTLKTLMTSCRH
jgi:hypothetical protein